MDLNHRSVVHFRPLLWAGKFGIFRFGISHFTLLNNLQVMLKPPKITLVPDKIEKRI